METFFSSSSFCFLTALFIISFVKKIKQDSAAKINAVFLHGLVLSSHDDCITIMTDSDEAFFFSLEERWGSRESL